MFRVKLPKKIYENETLSISAQLYDANYELLNEPEANILLRNTQGREFAYTLNKTAQSYDLDVNDLEAEQYELHKTIDGKPHFLHLVSAEKSVGYYSETIGFWPVIWKDFPIEQVQVWKRK